MSTLERLTAALAGRYRVARELGAGGMATVYLAHDEKHERDVAIKVLHPDLGAALGADRFLAEIKTTAKLQHPHILPLLDSGAADGLLYYVMPFVRGETLRTRLERETQLPVDAALEIAKEVADALEHAHRQGVVHRDVKPENILLQDGHALVADFGIALAVQTASASRVTQTGLSLGTPQYMAPEQAMGEKQIDARADVYALGAVTYEMLTGEPPFTGPSLQAIVARVLSEEPRPLTAQRKAVPGYVEAAVLRALEKLPADRIATAAQFSEALRGVGAIAAAARKAPARPRAQGQGLFLRLAPWGIAAVAVAIASWLAMRPVPGRSPDLTRFAVDLPRGYERSFLQRIDASPWAIARDGRHVAVSVLRFDSAATSERLFLRPIGEVDGHFVTGGDGALAPVFSPDGEWIAFLTRSGQVRKVPTKGGQSVTLATDAGARSGALTWGDDDTLTYVGDKRRLQRVAASGGTPRPVRVDTSMWWGVPQAMPGSRHLLVRRCPPGCATSDLVALDPANDAVTMVQPDAALGSYLPPGYLAYAGNQTGPQLVAFDLATLKPVGAPIPLPAFVLGSVSGAQVSLPPAPPRPSQIVSVDRDGTERVIIGERGTYANPRLAPDGSALLYARSGRLQLYSFANQTVTALLRDSAAFRPTWSPDGRSIVYTARDGLRLMPVDGSRPPERLVQAGPEVISTVSSSWSRDGQWIIYDGTPRDAEPGTREGLFAVPPTGKRVAERVLSVQGDAEAGSLSPNGQWLAYNSNEADVVKVFIAPFRAPGLHVPISTGAATSPVWISDRELAFTDIETKQLVVAELDLASGVRVVRRTPLFRVDAYRHGNPSEVSYDVSRDGRQFYFVKLLGEAAPTRLVVTLHWAEELRTLFATGRTP